MLAPSGELLRAGMALKINHLKRAARSYLRDRTNQATGRATSYGVAAGLFAVAGLFLIAAFFVGLIALYRWVAIAYGQFWGFGAVAAVLLVLGAEVERAHREDALAREAEELLRVRVRVDEEPAVDVEK